MSNHVRRQIRDALKAKLATTATAGAHVFSNRFEAFEANALPALVVMSDSDVVAQRSQSSVVVPHIRSEMRTLTFRIQALVKQPTAVDDALDGICKEVEADLGSDVMLGGLVSDSRLVSTAFQFDETSDQPEGIAEMRWEFDVWVANNAPDVLI